MGPKQAPVPARITVQGIQHDVSAGVKFGDFYRQVHVDLVFVLLTWSPHILRHMSQSPCSLATEHNG